MSERVLIVDADLIAYRYAAANEKRTIIAKHIKSNKEKIFKTRTELKTFLKEKDIEFKAEDYEIEDVQTAASVEIALKNIKGILEGLREHTWADRVELYLGTGKTFRHKLALPTPYKDKRDDLLKPLQLQEARKYLMTKYKAQLVKELEVDDVVTIRAYEEKAKGNYPILVSVDKDAQQSQGIEVLNWDKDPWESKLIPDVGTLWKEKTTVKGDGLKFLAFQTLVGDSTDTYCGYHLSELKYGPMKAVKALEEANTEKAVLEVLISEYKRLYPTPVIYTDVHGIEHESEWDDLLQLYWDCAYMKRSWDDPSSFMQFAMERGVNLYDN